MTSTQLHYFTEITRFLGVTLGPDYEVALHDISNNNGALVAIANSHISGRRIGAPLPDSARKLIEEKYPEVDSFISHYYTLTDDKKVLRSSTMFIKDRTGNLLGLLCINFDDSRYRELSQKVLGLCHPDAFVDTNFDFDRSRLAAKEHTDHAVKAVSASGGNVSAMIIDILKSHGISGESLSFEEKMIVVKELDSRGAFLIKGAVKEIADLIGSSPASIYRYLSKLKK